AMHRNLYIDAPRVLGERLELRAAPHVHLAGQIVGVEGYVESAAMGLLVGLWLGRRLRGLGFEPPPRTTAVGALYAHVRGAFGEGRKYEPMNIHFGLFPEVRARGRMRRRAAICDRARRDFEMWLERLEGMK
ncbi:MAG: methylenetetrahydrofolate--tRNA-(uracil(54)-C(5))-methyltransferase (FADH(2)-oxidizing) TrmFO, partial [Deltaproteobacteria bacterium]